MPKLYSAQQRAVDAFCNQAQPRRRVWAWDTGAGKTAGALTVARMLGYRHVLIVTPAIVRRHWLREVDKWSGRPDVSVIELGRQRKVSRTAAERRDATYAANVQIVSYDLVSDVEDKPWQLIIFDEAHHLANPGSKQARNCEAKLLANPYCDVLALTATLIPTEAAQVWNTMRLLFGAVRWGQPAKLYGQNAHSRNLINWNFRMRYCHVERTEYGVQTWGCREDRRKELAQRMKPHVDVLHREDIAPDMPPLDLTLLDLPSISGERHQRERGGRHGIMMREAATLLAWAETCADDTSHIVILVHHRDFVEELRRQVIECSLGLRNHSLHVVTGAMTPTNRQATLDVCARTEKVILLGTHDSLSEGVRMMWAKQVMIDEWSTSPGKVLQLLGRFQSVGSEARPCVHLRAMADTWAIAQKLLERVEVVQTLLTGGEAVQRLTQVLSDTGLTQEQLANSWASLLDNQRDGAMNDEVSA